MKWKIIILIVIIIAIIVLAYFLLRKPSGSSVVQPASTTTSATILGAILGGGTSSVAHTTSSGAGVGTGTGVGTSGVVASTTPKVGMNAYANTKAGVYNESDGSLRKWVLKDEWAGVVKSNVGAVTYLSFPDGTTGRVLTSEVYTK